MTVTKACEFLQGKKNIFKKKLLYVLEILKKNQMHYDKTEAILNQLKIQNQWRKIMRLAKTESLKKDIEILSQNHERDVDRKDAILQMLDRYYILLMKCIIETIFFILIF